MARWKALLLAAALAFYAATLAAAGAPWLVALTGGAVAVVGLSLIDLWFDRRERRSKATSARRASILYPPFPAVSPEAPEATMPHPLVPVGALHLTDGLCYKAPDPPKVEPRGSHA